MGKSNRNFYLKNYTISLCAVCGKLNSGVVMGPTQTINLCELCDLCGEIVVLR